MSKRPSARLIVVDAEGRTLLFRFAYGGRTFWATPGGALDADESFEQAAKRELFEETGLRTSIGPQIFERRTHFDGPDGQPIDAVEHYFIV